MKPCFMLCNWRCGGVVVVVFRLVPRQQQHGIGMAFGLCKCDWGRDLKPFPNYSGYLHAPCNRAFPLPVRGSTSCALPNSNLVSNSDSRIKYYHSFGNSWKLCFRMPNVELWILWRGPMNWIGTKNWKRYSPTSWDWIRGGCPPWPGAFGITKVLPYRNGRRPTGIQWSHHHHFHHHRFSLPLPPVCSIRRSMPKK